MQILLHKKQLKYTGAELSPHFIYRNFGLLGDALVAFAGECEVREQLVDLEDSLNRDFIYSPKMLHFLLEHFGMGLAEAVARQRLFAAIIRELLPAGVRREGDDLYYRGGKLSVSIATVSPVSALIHFGLNIETAGCPVAAAGLSDLKVKPFKLAQEACRIYRDEHNSIRKACCKVIPR